MARFLKNQWIAILATLLAAGSLGFAFASTNNTVTTVEAIRILCEKGEPGSTGSAGIDGDQGLPGETGTQGQTGVTGPQGIQGECGPEGPAGAVGPQGIQGEQGLKGDQGIQGEVGPIGPMGPTGPVGPQGPTGATGPIGPTGATGPAGVAGPIGPRGDAGATGATGPQGPAGPAAAEVSYTVGGGTLSGTQPTFNGSPLFSGSYVKNGNQVFFQIKVDFDNITSFGTGQYYVTLPFVAKYDFTLRNGHITRSSNSRNYAITGYVTAGSSNMTLWYTTSASQDEPFDYRNPFALTTSDSFHISGTYLSQ